MILFRRATLSPPSPNTRAGKRTSLASRVSFRTTSGAHHGCGVYVEGYMYHVAVKLREDAEPECAVSLPLFSDLLGWRFLVSLGSGA